MAKKRRRVARQSAQTIGSKRGHRTRVMVLSLVAALATLAMVVAGFLTTLPKS